MLALRNPYSDGLLAKLGQDAARVVVNTNCEKRAAKWKTGLVVQHE